MTDTTTASAAHAGTIRLGPDLTVNRLGFGAMRITGSGIWGPPADPDEAVLRRAVTLGVNFIDTADAYGPDVSETLIAEALAPYPDDLVIATKGGLLRSGLEPMVSRRPAQHLKAACEGEPRPARRGPDRGLRVAPAGSGGAPRGLSRRTRRAEGAGQDPPHRRLQRR